MMVPLTKRRGEVRMISRRQLLTGTALASAALGAGVGTARAFGIEEPAVSLADQYRAARAACVAGSQTYHEKVLADVLALIDGQELPDDERRRIVAGATCPLCGCSLAAS
jgi:hypothetical protein